MRQNLYSLGVFTGGQTDGYAVAYTALTNLALHCNKMGCQLVSVSVETKSDETRFPFNSRQCVCSYVPLTVFAPATLTLTW